MSDEDPTRAGDETAAVRPADATHTLGTARPAASPASGLPLPGAVGNYRILRRLGEGGMGVVYEAEQNQPRRRVALKVIRGGHHVDEVHLRLFKREAESLARLRHPGIAAIYESGATPDGQHYFAMELVQGPTLDEYLRGRPEPFERGELEHRLRLFERICDAVHSAHQRGVIHRDLKPSNMIVVEEPGGAPAIKILDFGLARISDPDVAGATLQSEIGVIRGTLPYMSPEQARGNPEEIDLRTDVYALGVVLYEMVAGRMPYQVGRTSIVEAVRVICEERPAPLREAWRGRGRLDPDLETVVGKALEKEADQRYAGAAALGDDVARVRTGQPIQARPPSTLYQLRKAVARNRLPFGLAAAAVLVLIGLAAGMSLLYARAERNRVRAVAAEERALRNFDMARGAVDKYLTSVSESPELKSAGLEPLRRDLLDTARRFYEQFATQQQGSTALRHELAWANLRLGDIDRATGDSAHAEQAYREGIRLAEALAAEHPDDPSFARQEVALQANLGTLYTDLARHAEAEQALRRGLELATSLQAREPGSAEDRLSQAMLADRLGILLERMQRGADAEASYREGLALREALVAADPRPAYRYALVESATNLGAVLARAGRPQEAEPFLDRAVALSDGLARESPGDETYIHGRAAAWGNLAGVYMLTGRLDRAGEAYRQELDAREQLARKHPTILDYRLVHAGALTNLGELETRAGRPAEALPWYSAAIGQLESLLAVEPRHANGRFYLSYTFSWKARALEALGRRGDALAAWERAMALDDRKDPALAAERDRLRAQDAS